MITIGEIYDKIKEIEKQEIVLLSMQQKKYQERNAIDFTFSNQEIEDQVRYIEILKSQSVG